MRIFAPTHLRLMQRLAWKVPIYHGMVTRAIERAQKQWTRITSRSQHLLDTTT